MNSLNFMYKYISKHTYNINLYKNKKNNDKILEHIQK